jgi:hypothetical protein
MNGASSRLNTGIAIMAADKNRQQMRSLDGMKWNPGSQFPDYAALHPGYTY